uniref:histone H2B type F-M-like n=1 Tax=Odobenus rosmarus divergens TaxID=9708 RepID=UPI00063CCDFF|nr:PREDICTED: histone H2B type F-M-like [Odobenus rosmarus divergens]
MPPTPPSFAAYFPRVLKQVHEGLSLSQKTVSILDSFVKDMFDRIADEASRLARSTKCSTITTREIQTAVRLLLPGEIGKHAESEATKAIIRKAWAQTEDPTAADPNSPKQKQPTRQCCRCCCHHHPLNNTAPPSPLQFHHLFPRVLRHVHKGLSPSQTTVSIMDSFVKDIFKHIAEEASCLARSTNRSTITSREIQTAVHLLLPREIGKHDVSEATKAIIRYTFRQ